MAGNFFFQLFQLSSEQRRMTCRYILSVFFGTLGILLLQTYFQSNYDSVAAVALFSCIIAVAGEDQSLGPVISKSLFRILGVFIGGVFGYVFLYIPTNLFPQQKVECLLIIPALFCGFIQWITKGGLPSLTTLIKTKKATHLLIQIQVAFGIVYVGSWDAFDRGLLVAVCRTCAIMYGCLALLIASLISYPQTSMNVCNLETAISLRSVGKLFLAICNDRVECIEMGPYDHRGKIFATLISPDDHMKIIDTIDAKLTRVSSLLPFLYLEPAWVPGLPLQLIGTEGRLASNWGLFIGVLHSRLARIRSTLITMDSNSRLTRDMKSKQINQEICNEIKKITQQISQSFNLMATYVESPYLTHSGWKGNLTLKNDFMNECLSLKSSIEVFSIMITKKIIEFIDEKKMFYDVSHNITEGEFSLPLFPHDDGDDGGVGGGGGGGLGRENEQQQHQSRMNLRMGIERNGSPESQQQQQQQQHYAAAVSEMSSPKHHKSIPYRNRSSVLIRDRVGMSLDYYHRLYPNKTFCNLVIQFCLQTISFHREVIDFIDSIEGDDEEDEMGSHSLHPEGYRSVGEKDVENGNEKRKRAIELSQLSSPPPPPSSSSLSSSSSSSLLTEQPPSSVLNVVENPMLSGDFV